MIEYIQRNVTKEIIQKKMNVRNKSSIKFFEMLLK